MQHNFYDYKGPLKLAEIAEKIGAEIVPPDSGGNPAELMISGVTNIDKAGKQELTFIINDKYENSIATSKATGAIVSVATAERFQGKMWFLTSSNPHYAYALAVDLFYQPKVDLKKASTAIIATSAQIGEDAVIGHYSVIGENVVIGKAARIGANCTIEANVVIGDDARIDSNVTISHSIIGDKVVILPGARIGQDGFGFATQQGKHKKIYHTGRVVIGNDVEIGANTTIDRGSANDTIIADGVRIDNLVQIGHNVNIGKGSVIVAQVGIAGSTIIGNYCALGGQVGVAGHLKIADQVQLAGQAGVISNIETKGTYGGTPAMPVRAWHKQTILLRKMLVQGKE